MAENWPIRLFKSFQGYLKKKLKTVLTTYVLLGTVNEVNIKIFTTKNTMAPTTMKCQLPNVHELFSFSSCYSSPLN